MRFAGFTFACYQLSRYETSIPLALRAPEHRVAADSNNQDNQRRTFILRNAPSNICLRPVLPINAPYLPPPLPLATLLSPCCNRFSVPWPIHESMAPSKSYRPSFFSAFALLVDGTISLACLHPQSPTPEPRDPPPSTQQLPLHLSRPPLPAFGRSPLLPSPLLLPPRTPPSRHERYPLRSPPGCSVSPSFTACLSLGNISPQTCGQYPTPLQPKAATGNPRQAQRPSPIPLERTELTWDWTAIGHKGRLDLRSSQARLIYALWPQFRLNPMPGVRSLLPRQGTFCATPRIRRSAN